jgi:tetratricopeptide (TPR) repeat protein
MQCVIAMDISHRNEPVLVPRASNVGFDARGCRVSGANARAIAHFETALAASVAWRGGAEAPLALALREAPRFVMAHVMQVYLLLLSRDVRRVRQTYAVLEAAMRAQPLGTLLRREQLHLEAIAAVLTDDYERAKALLSTILRLEPRDILALQTAHSFDYLTGDLARLGDRVAQVLPAWSKEMPGYHAVLSMHAFSLVECGEVASAERAARAALELNPLDARAHHAMAHVFATSGRAAEGVDWMNRHLDVWSSSTAVATHCAWHLALFQLSVGNLEATLKVYDERIRAHGKQAEVAELIDASALLWRAELQGARVGACWPALADAWAPHLNDAFCSFNDIHAMLALVGARQWDRARQLEQTLIAAQARDTRYGATTRTLGLPVARALVAFGQGQYTQAITLLASLTSSMHRLGGSHAQRDVLHVTLQQALERIRRPGDATPRQASGEGRSGTRATATRTARTCSVCSANSHEVLSV